MIALKFDEIDRTQMGSFILSVAKPDCVDLVSLDIYKKDIKT